jgi:hypothetical protein
MVTPRPGPDDTRAGAARSAFVNTAKRHMPGSAEPPDRLPIRRPSGYMPGIGSTTHSPSDPHCGRRVAAPAGPGSQDCHLGVLASGVESGQLSNLFPLRTALLFDLGLAVSQVDGI